MTTKRNLIRLWLITALLFVLPALSEAQLTFTTNNGTITITGYTGNPTNLNIPGLTNGYTVTDIMDDAFAGIGSLTNVIIPDGVTNLGNLSFYGCTNLIAAKMPAKLVTIGSDAFAYCSRLAGLTISSGACSLGDFVFEGCAGLTNIVIPDSVTNLGSYDFNECINLNHAIIGSQVADIGEGEFEECSNLASLVIPNSVTQIGRLAFESCVGLTNVIIGNGVTTIGDYAFISCLNLASVAIPASVTNIGNNVFIQCPNLISITVNSSNAAYSSMGGILFDKGQTLLIRYPEGRAGDYIVPNGIMSLASGAFLYCNALTNIIIPASVTNLGAEALSPCASLSGIFFEGNPPTLGSGVFSGDSATIYYLAGAIGWSSPFGGLPAILWNPQPQTSGSGFGVRTNHFGFNITGMANIPIVVEASTNLAGAWVPLQSLNLTNGSFYFSDSQWTNYPGRFYRISSP